jgi:lambda repressor-like predicted transcriptional regulator
MKMTTDSPPARIRAALSAGPLTMAQLAERAGLPIDAIRPVVWNMTRNGSVILEKTYRLPTDADEAQI